MPLSQRNPWQSEELTQSGICAASGRKFSVTKEGLLQRAPPHMISDASTPATRISVRDAGFHRPGVQTFHLVKYSLHPDNNITQQSCTMPIYCRGNAKPANAAVSAIEPFFRHRGRANRG